MLTTIDHLNRRHRLACFTSLFNDVEERRRSYVDSVEFPKAQSLRMHQIRGSPGVSALRIMFVLHNTYVYARGSLREKQRRQQWN